MNLLLQVSGDSRIVVFTETIYIYLRNKAINKQLRR